MAEEGASVNGDAGSPVPAASASASAPTPPVSSKSARKSKGQAGKQAPAEQEAIGTMAAAPSPAPSASETKSKAAGRKSGTSKAGQTTSGSSGSSKLTKDSLISAVTNMNADSELADTSMGTAAPANKSANTTSSLAALRMQAVKLADGEPILRADLQHNLLAHIFGDKTRVFTNPRPTARLPAANAPNPRAPIEMVAAPLCPEGQAEGTTRRSDETPEEYEEWKQRLDRVNAARARKAAREEKRAARAKKLALERANADEPAEEADPADEGNTSKPAFSLAEAAGDTTAAAEEEEEELHEDDDILLKDSAVMTFKELYIESLITSHKTSRTIRSNIANDPVYAEALAKVCFLLNVGRMNTTLAFYPEMKTMLRSYHAIPSLQTTEVTRKNLQDTPRLKALIKGQQLENEKPVYILTGGPAPNAATIEAARVAEEKGLVEPPTTLDELMAERWEAKGLHPPTNIVFLLFIFTLQAEEVADLHFDLGVDGWSIFFPDAKKPIPSRQRARAFLWLVWHYLEGGAALPPGKNGPNPFADEQSLKSVEEARKAWDALSTEEQERMRKDHGRWKGIPVEQEKEKDGDGDMKMEDAGEVPSVLVPAVSDAPAARAKYTRRIVAPRMDIVAAEGIAQENVDTEEEVNFGAEMQRSRSEFVSKIAEDSKVAEESSVAGDQSVDGEGTPAPAGDVKLKRAKSKKRPSLLSALEGAAAGNGAAKKKQKLGSVDAETSSVKDDKIADKPAPKASKGKSKKVQKNMDIDAEVEGEDDAQTVGEDQVKVEIGEEAPAEGVMEPGLPDKILEDLWHKPLLDPSLAKPGRDSLPRQAWRRILERAAQGIGDASYDSDTEEQATYEAKDDKVKPKLELARYLGAIRSSRVVTTLVNKQTHAI